MKAQEILTQAHRARINRLANAEARIGGKVGYSQRYRLLQAALTVEALKRIANGEDLDVLLADHEGKERKRRREMRAMLREKLANLKRIE